MWLISLEVRLMSHVLWCYLLSATWTAPWRSLMRTQPTWWGSRLPSQRIYPNVKLHSTMSGSSWLQYSSNPNPCFKDLKCLPKGEWEGVWTSLEALLQEESKSATREPTEESAKKKRLLLCSSDSDSDDDVGPNRALSLYRAEPTISETDWWWVLWWSTHAEAHPELPASIWLAMPLLSLVRDFSHMQVT